MKQDHANPDWASLIATQPSAALIPTALRPLVKQVDAQARAMRFIGELRPECLRDERVPRNVFGPRLAQHAHRFERRGVAGMEHQHQADLLRRGARAARAARRGERAAPGGGVAARQGGGEVEQGAEPAHAGCGRAQCA